MSLYISNRNRENTKKLSDSDSEQSESDNDDCTVTGYEAANHNAAPAEDHVDQRQDAKSTDNIKTANPTKTTCNTDATELNHGKKLENEDKHQSVVSKVITVERKGTASDEKTKSAGNIIIVPKKIFNLKSLLAEKESVTRALKSNQVR